jgi:hypothetical protein
MAKSRAEQVGNGNGRKGSFLPEGCLRAPRFEAQDVGLLEMDLGGFLDDNEAVVWRNVSG